MPLNDSPSKNPLPLTMEVTTTDLGHHFAGGPWLFRHLNLSFPQGTTTALTGPSGCGKSTLLALIGGQLEAAEGEIQSSGIARVGWVPQQPYGVRHRSALDHVTVPLLARGAGRQEAEEQARELLAAVGLPGREERAFMRLSGGESQRLGLARALAAEHDLLLIDEPTAQLDAGSAATIIELITGLRDHGRIIILSTHDPRLAGSTDAVVDLLEVGQQASISAERTPV